LVERRKGCSLLGSIILLWGEEKDLIALYFFLPKYVVCRPILASSDESAMNTVRKQGEEQ